MRICSLPNIPPHPSSLALFLVDSIKGAKTRAQLLHTLMKRAGEVCAGDDEFKDLEEAFVGMLKQ